MSNNLKILYMKDVMDMAGISRMTIYRWIKEDKFPAATKIGSCNAWRYQKVMDWIQEQFDS